MRPGRFGLAVLGWALLSLGALGLTAQSAAAAAPPKPPEITKEARAQGMKETPALLVAANLPCKLADARFLGAAPDPKTKKDVKYFEVACVNAIGYVLLDHGKDGPPSWVSCLDQAKVDPLGKPNAVACNLPGNNDWKGEIAPFVAKVKVPCDVTDVRGIGHTDKNGFFEVACANGHGYILTTSAPPSPDQPVQMLPCAVADPTSPVSCKLVTAASQLAFADALAAQSGKNCQVTNRRYMIATEDLSNYYEIACQGGKGYVLHEGPDGKLVETIPCELADRIGDGCTLTNSREAETEQAGLYTKLAHNAGFPCDVSKYGPIPADVAGYEVVELACSNREDGAIGVFPADSSKPTHLYDCVTSELVGYRCSFTKPDAAFPRLTDDLKKLGKTTCVVSNAKVLGTTPDKLGYVEVACADGNPGYIVSYSLADMSPKDATACSFAKDMAGGCKMPENTKHA
jgi:hypothetical protein